MNSDDNDLQYLNIFFSLGSTKWWPVEWYSVAHELLLTNNFIDTNVILARRVFSSTCHKGSHTHV